MAGRLCVTQALLSAPGKPCERRKEFFRKVSHPNPDNITLSTIATATIISTISKTTRPRHHCNFTHVDARPHIIFVNAALVRAVPASVGTRASRELGLDNGHRCEYNRLAIRLGQFSWLE